MRYHKQLEEERSGDICTWHDSNLTDGEAAVLLQTIQDSLKPADGHTLLAIVLDIQVQVIATKRPPIQTQSPQSRLAALLDAVKAECVKMADYGSASEALALAEKIRKEQSK